MLDKPVKERFAMRLKEIRDDRGLSQAALARKLGVSQSTVGGWETCKREPTLEGIEDIADILGVTIDFMFGKTDIPLAVYKQDTPYIEVSPFEKRIIETYRSLSESEQMMICRMLRIEHPIETRSKAKKA